VYSKVFLITDEVKNSEVFSKILDYLKVEHKIVPKVFSSSKVVKNSNDDELYLLYLDDEKIKKFFKNNIDKNLNIGIISDEICPNAIKNYNLSTDIFESIKDAFNKDLLSKIDLLQCNETIVFDSVIIGDMHGINKKDYNERSRFEKLKIFFQNFKNLKFQNYNFTISKDQTIKTVAVGIKVVEHTTSSANTTMTGDLSINDGKLNAFILVPTSILSYIWYLIVILFYQKLSLMSLPKSLGLIQTSQLTITSSDVISYTLDKELFDAKEIKLKIFQDSFNIHLGKDLFGKLNKDNKEVQNKDLIDLDILPKGEIKSILIDGKIPFIKKASEDDFKDVFKNLRTSARLTYPFLVLMILSTLLATTGLFANSTPVIIGAMILAPMMAPIISFSMGIIRSDKILLKRSIITLSIGVFMAILFSCFFTLLLPLSEVTPEMQSRIKPNLLDLLVAIFSGIAGAYAYSKEEVAKSLAGVAIAVALVPPLSVTGIGIGLGDYEVIYGAFLLFNTNLVGITISSALTFIVLGFAPLKRAKVGIIYTTAILVLISIPLVISFEQMVAKNEYYEKLSTFKVVASGTNQIELIILDVQNHQEAVLINIETTSKGPLSSKDYQQIKEKFESKIDKQVIIEVVSKIVVK